jgi:hypothetical protein
MDRLDPTNRLLAVIDDPEAARAAATRLGKDLSGADVTLLVGPRDAERIDAAGRRGGRWLRLKRIVALTQADQSVDLATYEAALRDGRAVVAVRPTAAERARALEIVRDAGAHFVNSYGLLMTQEHVPWRGERLPLPPFLQR